MGVDYVVDLDCAPKDALGVQGVVDLLKARARAEYVRDVFRANGDHRPLSEMTFETVVLRPEGPVEESVSVQSLFDRAAALEPHAPACQGCEARCQPIPFGCVGYVSYPVQPATEAWLLEQLPVDLGSPAGTMLASAFRDFGWDGGFTQRLRAQGDTFFTEPAGRHRQWSGGFSVSNDQLWQILFGLGHLSPAHSMMCALFLGVIPHHTTAEGLAQLSRDTARIGGHALRYEVGHEDPQIAEVARFLRAMGLAAALGVSLLIDG